MDLSSAFDALTDKLHGWLEALVLLLPNFVAAVLIVVVAWLAARGARGLVRSLFDRVNGHVGGTHQVRELVAGLTYVAVLAAGTFIALGVLQLDKAVTSLLAGAGIIGLALGFAFQDIASNFISGVLLAVRAPFDVGDILETQGYTGVVQDVNLRSTRLRTFDGRTVIIPNSGVLQNPMVNYTAVGQRRVDVEVGVGYGDDLEHAERVAIEAVEGIGYRDQSRDVELFYSAFGDSSINLTVRFWVDFRKQTDYLRARHDAIKRVKAAFDAHGVTIPFPIRTLDFGPNGGVAISDVRLGTSNGEA
jgi:small conductance mechanosensitive channel